MNGVASDEEFSLNPAGVGDQEEDEGALRAALHFSVGEICSAQEGKLPMTASAVSTLAEVVFKYTEALALDLRVFAKHGKRAIVGVDDVKCVARKDPKMVEKLTSFESSRNLNVGKKKAARKKKDKNQNQDRDQLHNQAQETESVAGGEGEKKASGKLRDGASSRPQAPSTSGRGAGARAEPMVAAGAPRRRQGAEHEEDPRRRPGPPQGRDGGGGGSGGGGKPGSESFVDLLVLDDNDDEDAFASSRHAAAGTGGGSARNDWSARDGGKGRARTERFNSDEEDDSDDDLLL